MRAFAMFAVTLTMLALLFCLLMLVIACFCYVVKKLKMIGKAGPRLSKWAEILDWLKEEKE